MTTTPTRTPRTRTFAVAGLLALAAVAVLVLGVLPTAADNGNDDLDPISVELLAGPAAFTDDVAAQIRNKFVGRGTDVMNLRDASNIAVAEITIQPGAIVPWHTHPGPVLITIADGEEDADAFVYVLAEDCVERSYQAGEALIDAGGNNVHLAYNPSETDATVVLATFLGADGDLTVAVDEQDELDAQCGIDRNHNTDH